MVVDVFVVGGGGEATLTPRTQETYALGINTELHTTKTTIIATDFFGARHALETLSQVVVSDENTGLLQVGSGDGLILPYWVIRPLCYSTHDDDDDDATTDTAADTAADTANTADTTTATAADSANTADTTTADTANTADTTTVYSY